MKIRPTTPNHPDGRYQQMTIYFFSDHSWTDGEILHQYLTASEESREDQELKKEFEAASRGGYQIDEKKERGWIGPIRGKQIPVDNGDSF